MSHQLKLMGALGVFVALSGCSSGPQPRTDRPPLADPIFRMALDVVGSDANADKIDRCLGLAYQLGVAIDPAAPTRAVLTLADHNHIQVLQNGGVVHDQEVGGWPMEPLCETAFGAAAEAAGLQVMTSKGEPGPECTAGGGVDSSYSGDYGAALTSIKLAAAKAHMNFVVLDAWAGGYGGSTAVRLTGRGYRCPVGAPAPSYDSPPPGGCEPDCSPGFVCSRGRCISACNPPCAAGAVCGADRICH